MRETFFIWSLALLSRLHRQHSFLLMRYCNCRKKLLSVRKFNYSYFFIWISPQIFQYSLIWQRVLRFFIRLHRLQHFFVQNLQFPLLQYFLHKRSTKTHRFCRKNSIILQQAKTKITQPKKYNEYKISDSKCSPICSHLSKRSPLSLSPFSPYEQNSGFSWKIYTPKLVFATVFMTFEEPIFT